MAGVHRNKHEGSRKGNSLGYDLKSWTRGTKKTADSSLRQKDVTVPIDVHVDDVSMLLSLLHFQAIHVYVYANLYTHFPPLPHSYTTIAISICIYVTIIM